MALTVAVVRHPQGQGLDAVQVAVATGAVLAYGPWPRLTDGAMSQIAWVCDDLVAADVPALTADLRSVWAGFPAEVTVVTEQTVTPAAPAPPPPPAQGG